eukprot:Gb_39469 [translate_table: standard]
MTEPTVLKMEEDVKALLEKASLLDFFQKFIGFSESISLQVSSIARENLPKPWDRMAIQVMKYLSLEALSLKGNLLRVSGTLVSKAQLLLGPTSSDQKPNVISFDVEEEEDSPSEDTGGKRDDNRKWKLAP